MRFTPVLFTTCLFVFSTQAVDAQSIRVDRISSFVDSTGTLGIQQVMSPRMQSKFVASRALAKDLPTWLLLEFPSNIRKGQYCIDLVLTETIELYYVDSSEGTDSIKVVRSGSFVPPSERSIGHPRTSCFLLNEGNQVVYVRIPPMEVSGRQIPDLEFSPYGKLKSDFDAVMNVTFVVSGGMLIIIVCSFFLWFFLADTSFLFFGTYLVCFYLMVNKSFLTILLGDAYPAIFLNRVANQVFFIMGPLTFALFSWVYFRIRLSSLIWRIVFISSIAFSAVCFILATFDYGVSTLAILFYNLVALVIVCAIAARRYFLDKWGPAGYFLAGISIPLVVAILIVAHNLDLIVINQLQMLANFSMLVFCFILGVGVVQRYRESARERLQKEREAELLRIKSAELEDLNQTKDKLLSVLSHDLRGPVGNLSAILSLLSQRGMTAEEFHSVSDKLKTDVETTYSMLEEVLQWVKSQREGIVVHPVSFVLKDVVDEVINVSSSQSNAKNIRVNVETHGSVTAFADRDHISIVLRNLISNAIKFSPQDSEIIITITSGDNNSTVMIKDSGTGLNPSDVQKILMHEKVIGTQGTRGEKGTGLGLHLCQEFIAYNNGVFHLASEKGSGTTAGFTILSSQRHVS